MPIDSSLNITEKYGTHWVNLLPASVGYNGQQSGKCMGKFAEDEMV